MTRPDHPRLTKVLYQAWLDAWQEAFSDVPDALAAALDENPDIRLSARHVRATGCERLREALVGPVADAIHGDDCTCPYTATDEDRAKARLALARHLRMLMTATVSAVLDRLAKSLATPTTGTAAVCAAQCPGCVAAIANEPPPAPEPEPVCAREGCGHGWDRHQEGCGCPGQGTCMTCDGLDGPFTGSCSGYLATGRVD